MSRAVFDRPAWPPGAEILCQCFDAYASWKERWSEDLEEVDDYEELVAVYSYMMDGIDIDLAKAMAKSDKSSSEASTLPADRTALNEQSEVR